MSFGQSISHVLKNLTNFSGRASRSEFWWWYLCILIINIIVSIIINAASGSNGMNTGLAIVLWIISLILFLATLAVAVRRLHDTNRSGWWCLLYLLCCIGPIILIIFWAMPSTGPNAHGEAAPRG